MMLMERDVVLSNNPSQKEILKGINNLFKKHWLRGYSYIKRNPQSMRSRNLPHSIQTPLFAQYALYMQMLDKNVDKDFCEISPEIKKEVQHWNNEGAYCIYMSILFYALLRKSKLVKEEDVSFYQGYYDFQLRDDFPTFLSVSERQIGIHAWLTIQGSVVDITANQNSYLFDFGFKEISVILGNYDPDYRLVGFKETQDTINTYLKKFSDYSGKTIDEWINSHHKESAVQMQMA